MEINKKNNMLWSTTSGEIDDFAYYLFINSEKYNENYPMSQYTFMYNSKINYYNNFYNKAKIELRKEKY